jgi:phosphate:Na+ symporter
MFQKKRIVLGNFLFNLFVTIFAYLLYPILLLITDFFYISDPLIALVLFSTIINLGSIIIFIPY